MLVRWRQIGPLGGRKRPAGEGHLRAVVRRPNAPTTAHVFCGNSDTDIWPCRRGQLQIRNRRLCNALLRNLIPRSRNLKIGRPCRGRWLSSSRNSSRNVVHRGGEKTRSAEPTPCRERIFPAGGVDRPVLGRSWCSPPLRWTRKQPRSLPRLARIKCALGRRGQRQHREHDLRPLRAVRVSPKARWRGRAGHHAAAGARGSGDHL